jgi:hypothetical protein
MALLHRAELRPSKIELVQGWAPAQPWFAGDAADLTSVGAFRFDDPDGEVGIETLLVRAGDGPVLQVPLTYRGAPLDGGERSLIGTMEHSVLGTRWVYDAVGDPAYLLAVATAVLTGGRQAELYVEIDGEMVRREPSALVVGSGAPGTPVPPLAAVGEISTRYQEGSTVVEAGSLVLAVIRAPVPTGPGGRHLDEPAPAAGTVHGELTGTWSGRPDPVTLVRVQTT